MSLRIGRPFILGFLIFPQAKFPTSGIVAQGPLAIVTSPCLLFAETLLISHWGEVRLPVPAGRGPTSTKIDVRDVLLEPGKNVQAGGHCVFLSLFPSSAAKRASKESGLVSHQGNGWLRARERESLLLSYCTIRHIFVATKSHCPVTLFCVTYKTAAKELCVYTSRHYRPDI